MSSNPVEKCGLLTLYSTLFPNTTQAMFNLRYVFGSLLLLTQNQKVELPKVEVSHFKSKQSSVIVPQFFHENELPLLSQLFLLECPRAARCCSGIVCFLRRHLFPYGCNIFYIQSDGKETISTYQFFLYIHQIVAHDHLAPQSTLFFFSNIGMNFQKY